MNNSQSYFSSISFFKVKKYFLRVEFLFLLLSFHSVFAEAPSDSSVIDKSHLPTLSIAEGALSYIGDVGYSRLNQPFFTQNGFQIELQEHTNNRLSFSIFLLSGKVYGNEKTVNRTLNFQSGIVCDGVQLRYDFINKKNPHQILIPFISAGIEYMVFHPKADLKDANGNYYHYWKDGSIRNIAETDSNASEAIIIHRDYSYETELRDANLDGFGNFRESAIAFPVGAGARLKLSERCSMHFSSVCHFTTTDMIDGVSNQSIEQRQGNSRNDKFIFTSVSFRYDFSAPRITPRKIRKPKPWIDANNIDFDALAKEDADHDGVTDFNDVEALNPEHVKVDANGKPMDTDGDGIPDYRDDEPNSVKHALVNEKGVTITDELIEDKFRRDSLAALPAIIEYLKCVDKLSMGDSTRDENGKNILTQHTVIPKIYVKLDVNKNGVISPKEISDAIDEYLSGKSSYSTEEFYQLIDFFFKQR